MVHNASILNLQSPKNVMNTLQQISFEAARRTVKTFRNRVPRERDEDLREASHKAFSKNDYAHHECLV